MSTMTNSKLFAFVNVSVSRYTVLDFKIEHTVVVWQGKGFGVNCFRGGRCSEREGCSNIGIEHVDFELDGEGVGSNEGLIGVGCGIIF